MDIKYIVNSKTLKNSRYLISIDIGYSTTGVCVYDFKKSKYNTFSFKINKHFNFDMKHLSIPEYCLLSRKIVHWVIGQIIMKLEASSAILEFSFEVPNIVGSYAPALSILLNEYLHYLRMLGRVKTIYFTHNRLGGYFLKKRSFTKGEIKELLNETFPDNDMKNEHERDAFLACYCILNIVKNIKLSDKMRSLEKSTYSELQ